MLAWTDYEKRHPFNAHSPLQRFSFDSLCREQPNIRLPSLPVPVLSSRGILASSCGPRRIPLAYQNRKGPETRNPAPVRGLKVKYHGFQQVEMDD